MLRGGVRSCALRGRDDDIRCFTKTRQEQVTGGLSIVGSVGKTGQHQRRSGREGQATQLCARRRLWSDQKTISPLTRSNPRCSLHQDLRLAFVLCLFCSHAPSPKIFSPVLSLAWQAMNIAEK